MTEPEIFTRLQWRCIGTFRGGRSVAVAGDPIDRSVFYFGSTGGGIWKTLDGGQYWRNVSDGFFQRASVGALAVSHADPNVIYAGMGETTIRGNVSHGDGVYKSTDAGKTWAHLGLEATRGIGKVRVDPRNPEIVYVAAFGHAHGPNAERGLYKSIDGGATWDLILSRGENAGANDISLDLSNPRQLYVSFWEARRGPHYLSSGGPGCALLKSTDAGATWTDLSDKSGMPTGIKGKIGVAVSPAQAGRVWAIVEHDQGGVYRSDDSGETWERLNEDRRLRQRAWYYSHIYADPNDPNTVWILNVEMFRSVDGGKTFDVIPAPHGDNHDLWIDPADPERMILGNDGGATVSYNGGKSWSSQYSQPTAEMYHVTVDTQIPYRVYGSQQDNSSISIPSRSNHGMITRTEWYSVGGGEAGYIAVRSDNPSIVFAGEYQGIMTRYDHATGQEKVISVWPEEYSGSGAKDYRYRFQWTYPIVISHHDPNTLFCGGNHVFKSTNEGTSWEPISGDLTLNDPAAQEPSGGEITKDNTGAEIYGTVFTIAESPKQPGVIWAGSDDGLVHVTRDQGRTWTNVTPAGLPPLSLISLIEASPHEPSRAFIAANRYKFDDFRPYFFQTDDYGKTWTKIVSGIPKNDFSRAIREDPVRPGLLFGGTETGVYVTFDSGQNWSRLGGNVPVVPVHDLVITQNDLVLGTHGRSFWILDDMTIFRQLADESVSATEARLFAPRDSIRFATIPNYGHKPVPGQNYAFAATQVPAYDFTKIPDEDPKKIPLDAGENPPDGVIFYYSLLEEPAGQFSITVLDTRGKEIRTFTKRPKKEPAAASDETFPPAIPQEDEDDEGPFASAKAGLNRFVWNMRMPDVTKIESKGGDKPERTGPRVVPGDYQVRLTYGDTVLTQPFKILRDPRLSTTPREYQALFDLLTKICAKHDEINQTVNGIRRIREDVVLWARRADSAGKQSVVDSAKELTRKIDEIEDTLLQRKIESEQDSLNFPVKLNHKLAMLAFYLDMGEAAPTNQSVELYEHLSKLVDAQLAAWKRLLRAEVKAFNNVVRTAKMPPIPV